MQRYRSSCKELNLQNWISIWIGWIFRTDRTFHSVGCRVGSRMYEEGEMVRDIEWKAACDNCFCAMGAIRCVPLACAPPLQGCSPIVREGHCCPSTYNCSESQCLRIRVATISPFTRLGPPLDCVFSASIIFSPWRIPRIRVNYASWSRVLR